MDRRAWAVDVAVAAAVTAAELALLLDDGAASASALAATAVAGGALVLRRAAPAVVLGVALAAAAAIIAVGEAPAGLGILVALATVAARRERRVSLAALAATAVVVTALSVISAGDGDGPPSVLAGVLAAAPLCAGVWGLGAYVRSQARLREELARTAVQEERTAIARELHDIVAHSVGVMLLGVRGARDVLVTEPRVADETLAAVERSGERSIAELRRMLTVLRDPGMGADWRPQPALGDLAALLDEHRAAGLTSTWRSTARRGPCPTASSCPPSASCRRLSPTPAATPTRGGCGSR